MAKSIIYDLVSLLNPSPASPLCVNIYVFRIEQLSSRSLDSLVNAFEGAAIGFIASFIETHVLINTQVSRLFLRFLRAVMRSQFS